MTNTESAWSVSRINRLLRPLRCACASFAGVVSSKSCRGTNELNTLSVVSYSSTANIRTSHPRTNSHLSDDMTRDPDIVKKSSVVRDCFRNVITAVLSDFGPGDPSTEGIIPTLSTLCAKKLGERIPQEKLETATGIEDEDQLLQIVEGIYEAIPAHHRMWTVATHALQLVLLSCPYHPTLFRQLLEICLSCGLGPESMTVLQALLYNVCSPSTIAHSGVNINSGYLVDLLTTWKNGGWGCATFVGVFTAVLSDVFLADVWTCRGILRFATLVSSEDPASFSYMTRSMMQCLQNMSNRHNGINKDKQVINHIDLIRDQICVRLAQWVSILLDRTVEMGESTSVDIHMGVVELQSGVQCVMRVHTSKALFEVSDTLNCLASHLLQHPHTSNYVRSLLTVQLASQSPRTSTYGKLIVLIFNNIGILSLATIKNTVSRYAMYLRNANLLHMEASLWASTLEHVESIKCNLLPEDTNRCIGAYRQELIEVVEDAEKRCFGTVSKTLEPVAQQLSLSQGGSWMASCSSQEWRWEQSFGCWVIRTPAPKVDGKRRRLNHKSLPPNNQSYFSPLRLRARSVGRRQTLIPTTQSMILAPGRSSLRDLSSYPTFSRTRTHYLSSTHNFTSLLSSAHVNRTVLHRREHLLSSQNSDHPLDEEHSVTIENPPSPSTRAISIENSTSLCSHIDVLPEHQLLPSDDALDLLAYV